MNVNVYYRVMSSTADTTRSRRRGAELERALYEATLAELSEVGYDRLTMEGVAARARTGKAALYRRWPGKHALVLDAVRQSLPPLPGFDPRLPPRENLRAVFTALCQVLAGETSFPKLGVINGLFVDPLLRNAFAEAIVHPRLRVIESILAHAEQAGEVALGGLAPMAVQTGPALVINTFLLTGEPPTPQDIDRIVETVLPRRQGR